MSVFSYGETFLYTPRYVSTHTRANHGVFIWHDKGPTYETPVYNTRQNQQICLCELKIKKAFSHRHTNSLLGVIA